MPPRVDQRVADALARLLQRGVEYHAQRTEYATVEQVKPRLVLELHEGRESLSEKAGNLVIPADQRDVAESCEKDDTAVVTLMPDGRYLVRQFLRDSDEPVTASKAKVKQLEDDLAALEDDLAAVVSAASALTSRVSAVEKPVAAKGVRVTAFAVNNAVPGTTAMPFEANPGSISPALAAQQYESEPGMLNPANGQITLPEDGIYSAVGFFSFTGALAAGGTLVDLTIYGSLFGTGGQRLAEMRVNPSSVGPILSVASMFRAQAGDVIFLGVGQNTGSSQNTGGGNPLLPWYLAVTKLGEL